MIKSGMAKLLFDVLYLPLPVVCTPGVLFRLWSCILTSCVFHVSTCLFFVEQMYAILAKGEWEGLCERARWEHGRWSYWLEARQNQRRQELHSQRVWADARRPSSELQQSSLCICEISVLSLPCQRSWCIPRINRLSVLLTELRQTLTNFVEFC